MLHDIIGVLLREQSNTPKVPALKLQAELSIRRGRGGGARGRGIELENGNGAAGRMRVGKLMDVGWLNSATADSTLCVKTRHTRFSVGSHQF